MDMTILDTGDIIGSDLTSLESTHVFGYDEKWGSYTSCHLELKSYSNLILGH